MSVDWLDHVNIRTANLDAMSRFYACVLGLQAGERPPFSVNGAWHYCADKPAVHLVEVPAPPAGAMAPSSVKGVTTTGCPASANSMRPSDMLASS